MKIRPKVISVPVFCYLSGLHNMSSCYNGSEWAQGKFRDLEKLFSKRDSDDRNTQDEAQEEVAKGQQPPAYEEPDDVQEERNRFSFITDFLAEWVQGDAGQLEALQTDRNTDNGDAPQASGAKPSKSTDETAKNDPENISYKSHFFSLLSAAIISALYVL